jgi:hypothetical protein
VSIFEDHCSRAKVVSGVLVHKPVRGGWRHCFVALIALTRYTATELTLSPQFRRRCTASVVWPRHKA